MKNNIPKEDLIVSGNAGYSEVNHMGAWYVLEDMSVLFYGALTGIISCQMLDF